MQIEKYLKETQPIIYKIFQNGLENDRLSHAYLLSGNPGTPLLEVAKFLAKSLICDEPTPFACDNCITCLRVDDENYPDFIVYDGSKSTIKKDEVGEIEVQFEKTAFESKGIMIYILHLVENMTTEAINAILKFLEEPGKNVYAFLTTNNESIILPTIISRCQTIRLKNIDRNSVITKAIQLGVEKQDAELLSYFYNNEDLIFDFLQDIEDEDNDDKQDYLETKEILKDFLNNLTYPNKREVIYYTEKCISPLAKNKNETKLFIDMLISSIEDIMSLKQSSPIYITTFKEIYEPLIDKFKSLENIIVEILKIRNSINLNANTALLLDHLISTFAKEI